VRNSNNVEMAEMELENNDMYWLWDVNLYEIHDFLRHIHGL
jgi:hypothetical protein